MIGVSTQQSIRRNFEDEFVERLRAAGYDAVPSCRYISENKLVGEERLNEAIKRAGADGVIIRAS